MYDHIILLVLMVNIRNILIPSIYCFMSFVIHNTFFIIYIYLYVQVDGTAVGLSVTVARRYNVLKKMFYIYTLYPAPYTSDFLMTRTSYKNDLTTLSEHKMLVERKSRK